MYYYTQLLLDNSLLNNEQIQNIINELDVLYNYEPSEQFGYVTFENKKDFKKFVRRVNKVMR